MGFPEHTAIKVTLRVWAIDYWDDNIIALFIDGNEVWSRSHSTASRCGFGWQIEEDESMPDHWWGGESK